MTEELVSCPVCQTPNFTPRGLKAHKCKGGTRRNPETGMVDVVKPLSVLAQAAAAAKAQNGPIDEDLAAYERAGRQAYEIPVEVLAPLPGAANPAALVAAINDHHTRAQNDAAHAKAFGDSAVQAAILAGLQLVELKAVTPHGQWEAMFTGAEKRLKNPNGNHGSHLEFDRRTAAKYVAVATQLVSKKLQPEQSAVLMELARGGPMTQAAADLLTEITPAKSLRQTYLELGIVKPTPKEAAWLSDEPHPTATHQSPASAAATFRSAKDSARLEWFGTVKPGRVEAGSPAGMVLFELSQPAKGSLRLLAKDDLLEIADHFRSLAKLAAEYAKEK